MESNNPIYHWLSTVAGQQQSRHQHGAENQEQAKDTVPVTSVPRTRIPLEISDNLRGDGHSASRKRDSGHKGTKAPSTHETISGSEGHKRSRHSYEIRPRYKTREDRYEYKGPSSAVETQSQSRKGRIRKARGRKHTINDDFHAINITGNRLTLRKNTNLGMFSKGRSSCITDYPGNTPSNALAKPAPSIKSPRCAADSDLAFSEMNFLSRRNNPSPYPTSTARDTLNGQHEREHHSRELQSDHPVHGSKRNKSHPKNKFLDVNSQLDASVTPLFTFEKAPVSEMSAVSGHSWGTSSMSMSHNKRRKTSKESSSIPYTWTETEADNTDQSDALEQHLLSLLHVGVYPQALCSDNTNIVLGRRYWSLAELGKLLEERKASWSNQAGNKKRSSPEANMGKIAAAEATPQVVPEIAASDRLDFANAGSVQNEMSEQHPDSNLACETARGVNNRPHQEPSVLEKQQDIPRQASDRPDCLHHRAAMISNSPDRFIELRNEDQCEPFSHESGEDAELFPVCAPEAKQPHISDIEVYDLDRVDDDDDMLYRTLDAAYCAIVRPEVAAGVASNLQRSLESPEFYNDIPNSPESTGIRGYDILTRQSDAGEPEHLATASQDIIEERYEWPTQPSRQHKPPTSHSNYPCVDANNDIPWLTTGYGRPLPGNDTQQSQHPEIPDFWRQNKLY